MGLKLSEGGRRRLVEVSQTAEQSKEDLARLFGNAQAEVVVRGVLLGGYLPHYLCCIQSLAGTAYGKLGSWCKRSRRFQSVASGALGQFCSIW